MVFLRLTVKVYPRDQLHSSSSSSSSFRPILGDRDRDESSRISPTAGAGKPVSFMLVLEHPEGITLGGLSSLIQDKWKKLRPNAEPLRIKKLLDDSYESDDLDVDMTVADVFVDNGRARADGSDQRGTVRVIQKPAPYAPVRFPSVAQDWEAAADDFDQLLRTKREAVAKFPTILEEPQRAPDDHWRASSVHDQSHPREAPLPSTEREEIPGSPQEWAGKSLLDDANVPARRGSTVAATPQQKRMESQELGDYPSSLSIPVHHGQQSTASPKFTDAEALADEAFLSSPEASHDEQQSEPNSTTRKASTHTGLVPELAPIEEASQEYHTSISDPEQGDLHTDKQHGEDDDGEDEEDDENDEEEDDEGSSSDDQFGEESAVENDMNPTEEHLDGDGDVTMTGSASKKHHEAYGASRRAAEDLMSTEAAEAEGPVFSSRVGKRKKSMEDIMPNKEPRMGQFGSHAASSQETNHDKPDPGQPRTPTGSPSASRKGERTPSFSGLARRLSFSERPELPQQGLGLGITKSPPSKGPVIHNLAHDPEQSSKPKPRNSTPSSSAPIPRWGSAFQAQSTPSNAPSRSPATTPKQLHSALRKNSPAERPQERRSVSFIDEDVSIVHSKSTPRSTSENTTNPVTNSSSERRRSGPGSMVYPPSVAADEIEKIETKAEKERLEMRKRESEQLKDLKQKLKVAEEQSLDSKYRRKLEEACRTLGLIESYENASGKKPHTTLKKLRGKYGSQRRDIGELEASSKCNTTPRGDWKAVNSADKPPASKNATAKSQKSPHTTPQSQSRAAPSATKAATPESSARPRNSQANQPVTKGSNVSRVKNDDPDLPSAKAVQRAGNTSRSNATAVSRSVPKKSSLKETVVITSSESESESESENDSEANGQSQFKKVDSSQRGNAAKAQALAGASATPSRVASSAVWPRQPNSSQTRPSLKSIKADQKKQQQEKQQQEKQQSSQSNGQRRVRGVFDSPSDSDEDDSESEDSESEGESDSDDGDIQSSGRVGKLSAARRR